MPIFIANLTAMTKDVKSTKKHAYTLSNTLKIRL